MTKYMNSITSSMPAMMRTTQETAPCGGPPGFDFLPLAGLNFAITAMVAGWGLGARAGG